MLAKTAAIALGVTVTVLAGTLLGTLVPSGINYTNAELANSQLKRFVFYHLWQWLPTLNYAVGAVLGGAAATLAYAAPSAGIATGIGVFFPLLMVLASITSHVSYGFDSALGASVFGTAGAFVGQLLVQWIRLSAISRPQKETPPQRATSRSSTLRAIIAFPVAFFLTVFLFRFLLAVVGYEPYGSPVVLACLALFSATVLGNVASNVLSKSGSDLFPLSVGLAVPALLYLLGIASVFGIDFPYDTRLPAAVSQAVYWGFPVFTLKDLTPIQHSLLAICGIAGAYCGRSLALRPGGIPRNILWVMPCVNCIGTLALLAGIAVSQALETRSDVLILGGVLAGFLGSVPTLIVARIAKDETIFKLAALSLSISFIAVCLSSLAPFVMPRRRWTNNDSAAVANLRTINTAEVSYTSASGGRYGTMEDLIAAGLLDIGLNSTRSGYNFSISSTGSDYTVTATPAAANTGRYGYYSAPDGVVRYSTQATLAPEQMAGTPVP